VVALAERIDADRAQSLEFRLQNEDVLLVRAAEKPVFGWGTWGRNQIWSETGRLLTVTDGRWIILLGVGGWLLLLAEFGLLSLPVFMLWWQSRRSEVSVVPHVATLAVIQAINLVDLLPNATLTPLTWLFAGALLGHVEWLRAQGPRSVPADASPTMARQPAFRTVL
jgi:hypothetical protein